jgi:hypothetical protein
VLVSGLATKGTKILKQSVHRDLVFVAAKASVFFVTFVAKVFVFVVATVVSFP